MLERWTIIKITMGEENDASCWWRCRRDDLEGRVCCYISSNAAYVISVSFNSSGALVLWMCLDRTLSDALAVTRNEWQRYLATDRIGPFQIIHRVQKHTQNHIIYSFLAEVYFANIFQISHFPTALHQIILLQNCSSLLRSYEAKYSSSGIKKCRKRKIIPWELWMKRFHKKIIKIRLNTEK